MLRVVDDADAGESPLQEALSPFATARAAAEGIMPETNAWPGAGAKRESRRGSKSRLICMVGFCVSNSQDRQTRKLHAPS